MVLLVAGLVLTMAAVLAFALPTAQPDPVLSFEGPEDEALFGAGTVDDARFRFGVDQEDAVAAVTVALDDRDITDEATRDGRALVWVPEGLADGEYEIVATLDEQEVRRTFVVDTVAPTLSVDPPDGPVIGDAAYEVTGTVDDPEATVLVGDVEATVADGRFRAAVDSPADGPISVTAVDPAGNAAAAGEITLTWVPSRVRVEEMRAVHTSFHGWSTAATRDPVIEMIEDGLVNSVQLDLKDESGMVGYDTEVALAHEADAVAGLYDLPTAIAELHAMGVHVSGRIVAFADPVLSRHEWEHGDRDRVIQTADGEFYTGRYAGFVNFAHPDVRQYNIDIAVEAAQAGIDDILWDYVRRPDGAVEGFHFAGLGDRTPEEAVAGFVAEADEALAPYGVEHGASLYGIAVDRPHEIGQDVDVLAEHLDYVAPMLYPSHWGPGEYGVANPNEQPYDIIHASLSLWVEKVEGTRARVVPWLQDFSLGHSYGPAEVRAQLDAAMDVGVHSWLLWNAGMRYTPEALPPATPGTAVE